MGRRAARFTQADLARVFAAAKRCGMAVRVDLVAGVAEVVAAEDLPSQRPPVEPRPMPVL